MLYRAATLLLVCPPLLGLLIHGPLHAEKPAKVAFEKVRLTEEYFAEGASVGDFNQDGKPDIVCGPYWFEGPQFTTKHAFYDGKAFPNDRGYSDNLASAFLAG